MNEQPAPAMQRTCPCGAVLERPKHQPIGTMPRYCSNEHREKYGRFGRTYGVVMPRAFGVTKA